MIVLSHAQCSKIEVHGMYDNFDNGAKLSCLMNLKVSLGSKFGHDHNWHLPKNFWFDLVLTFKPHNI